MSGESAGRVAKNNESGEVYVTGERKGLGGNVKMGSDLFSWGGAGRKVKMGGGGWGIL